MLAEQSWTVTGGVTGGVLGLQSPSWLLMHTVAVGPAGEGRWWWWWWWWRRQQQWGQRWQGRCQLAGLRPHACSCSAAKGLP